MELPGNSFINIPIDDYGVVWIIKARPSAVNAMRSPWAVRRSKSCIDAGASIGGGVRGKRDWNGRHPLTLTLSLRERGTL